MPEKKTYTNLPYYTHVVTWGRSAWPAWKSNEGILIDLRLFDPQDKSPQPTLTFLPEHLARVGVPDDVILLAAGAEPPGFAFIQY